MPIHRVPSEEPWYLRNGRWGLLCREQLLSNSSSLSDFLKAEGMERVGHGAGVTLSLNSGAVLGLTGQNPTHCQAIIIITVLQFEMYSACFSKYEDLSNEF